jgi:hypothetical protein
VRQRAVWRVSLATSRKGDNDIGCVVAIDKATHKVEQISNYNKVCSQGLQFYFSQNNKLKNSSRMILYINMKRSYEAL